MRRAFWFVFYVAILFGLAFGLARFLEENSQSTSLRFFMWRTKEIGLGSLISMSFLGGVLTSCVFLIGTVFSKTFESRRLRRENLALQKMMEIREPKLHSSSSSTESADR